MYKSLDPSALGRFYFADRYADVAHRAWFSINGLSRQWRQEYYAGLLSMGTFSCDSFRLIEYHDERENTLVDCGIVGILPLNPQIAAAHLDGLISQYRFQESHLRIHQSPKLPSYHYIQSVFLHPDHVRSISAKRKMRAAILELLKLQCCGYRRRPFVVYAEPQTDAGRILAAGEGLRPMGRQSADDVEIYGFDSTLHSDPRVTAKFHEVWGPPRRAA
jgi:hypothetical protein